MNPELSADVHYVYSSHEQPANPYVDQFISFCSKLPRLLNTEHVSGSMSLSFAKRLITTNDSMTLDRIQPGDIVEIVDYDPIKDIFVLMGKTTPGSFANTHWLVQRAREDVQIVLLLFDEVVSSFQLNQVPETKKEYPIGTLDLTKEILRTLKTSSMTKIKNQGLIITSKSFQELEQIIKKLQRVTPHENQ